MKNQDAKRITLILIKVARGDMSWEEGFKRLMTMVPRRSPFAFMNLVDYEFDCRSLRLKGVSLEGDNAYPMIALMILRHFGPQFTPVFDMRKNGGH